MLEDKMQKKLKYYIRVSSGIFNVVLAEAVYEEKSEKKLTKAPVPISEDTEKAVIIFGDNSKLITPRRAITIENAFQQYSDKMSKYPDKFGYTLPHNYELTEDEAIKVYKYLLKLKRTNISFDFEMFILTNWLPPTPKALSSTTVDPDKDANLSQGSSVTKKAKKIEKAKRAKKR